MDRGDIDFAPIEKLGAFTRHEITAPAEISPRIADADIVLTNKAVLDRDLIAGAAPKLKLICVCATGVNNVDLDAAKKQRVAVCNVSGYSTPSVAQHTIGLLVNLAANLHRYASEASLWPRSEFFCRLDHPVVELAGRTLGIAGAGAIGTAVGRAAAALGMNVQVMGREGRLEATADGWPRLAPDDFFQSSDAVTLHCPLTPETHHLVNSESLKKLPAGAFLVNTGRGDLVDESALADALRSGHLGGAALDVLSREPPPPDHPLLDPAIPNLIITPHSAWSSRESRERLLAGVAANIAAFLQGTPINRVV